MGVRFREILSRLTGISTPVFGVSWTPPEAEVARARRVLTFLEDRRVLYVDSEMELPDHCVQSVLRIREFLTSELGSMDSIDDEFAGVLRAMRAACHKFLRTTQSLPDIVRYGASPGHWANWAFNGALGELRGAFGIHIARMAALHGLGVEDGLSAILPVADEED
jgi:hypothetical protein